MNLTSWLNKVFKKKQVKEEKATTFSRVYSTFSGVDIQIRLSNEPTFTPRPTNMEERKEWAKKYVLLPEAQAISWDIRPNAIAIYPYQHPHLGELHTILFNESQYHELNSFKHIYLCAANEYGYISDMAIHDYQLVQYCAGISVDDIAMEEKFIFSFKNFSPWKEWKVKQCQD